jgi:hypothetical protein
MVYFSASRPAFAGLGKTSAPLPGKRRSEQKAFVSMDQVQFAGSKPVARRVSLAAAAMASLAALVGACGPQHDGQAEKSSSPTTLATAPAGNSTAAAGDSGTSLEAPSADAGTSTNGTEVKQYPVDQQAGAPDICRPAAREEIFKHIKGQASAKFDTQLLGKFYATLPQDGQCNREFSHEQHLLSEDGQTIKASFTYSPIKGDSSLNHLSLYDRKNVREYYIFPDGTFADPGPSTGEAIPLPDDKTLQKHVQQAQSLLQEFLAEHDKGSNRISDKEACDIDPKSSPYC